AATLLARLVPLLVALVALRELLFAFVSVPVWQYVGAAFIGLVFVGMVYMVGLEKTERVTVNGIIVHRLRRLKIV
ncbi:MAG: hypothetical protein AAB912_00365, partial [Patescibacteria group bacterium]